MLVATLEQLKAMDADDIKVFIGGTIPPDDHAALIAAGVTDIFTSEMNLQDTIARLAEALA